MPPGWGVTRELWATALPGLAKPKPIHIMPKPKGPLLYSLDDDAIGNGQLGSGLFGAVNVQPEGAEWYRGQVTHEDLHLATYNANALPQNTQLSPTLDDQGKQITARVEGKELPVWTLTTVNPERQTVGTAQVVKLEGDDHLYTLTGHPVVNYQAVHP